MLFQEISHVAPVLAKSRPENFLLVVDLAFLSPVLEMVNVNSLLFLLLLLRSM